MMVLTTFFSGALMVASALFAENGDKALSAMFAWLSMVVFVFGINADFHDKTAEFITQALIASMGGGT